MLRGPWRKLLGGGADKIRAVLFDAVGTLITPTPPVVDAYHKYGRRHGSSLTKAQVRSRFTDAFSKSGSLNGRTDEEQERLRWRGIVGAVFNDVEDVDALFVELWNHFATPANWQIDETAPKLFAELTAAGCRVGVASNFDARLHGILSSQLGDVPIFVSSELGWQKPHQGFFRVIEYRLGIAPERLCLVGDDWENDIVGAERAGWKAIWLEPDPKRIGSPCKIPSLARLLSS
jgi:putative hydrolase of the HAD superfamily